MWFLTPTGDSSIFPGFPAHPYLALASGSCSVNGLLARDEVTTLALQALTAAPHPLRLLLGQENVPAELEPH